MLVLSPQVHDLLSRIVYRMTGFRRDDRGASAVEYGLLVAGIAAVICGAVFAFGQGIFSELFQETCDSINMTQGGGSC